ncbi:alpha-galactosidase [Longitalea arenae]|uniref:alpha-galactosidase n=1 Tax=Longitalea arenae TaxID=2812558 RepID=UPI0019684F31|nr:alpha-galactosidase [Longitalea arenae]
MFIVLLCLKITAGAMPAGKRDSVITMPFGENNMIVYSLTTGTYDVVFSGKKTIAGAFAVCSGKTEMTSAGAALRTHSFSTRTIHDRVSRYIIETVRNGLRMQQVFDVYGSRNYFLTTMRVIGRGAAASYMSPLTTDSVVVDEKGDNRALSVPFDNDMWARFNAQPIQHANFTSSEVTAIYNNDTYKGLIIGSVDQQVWKSGITVKANGVNSFSISAFGGFADSTITHDKIRHGLVTTTDTSCVSPMMMVGMFTDWRKGMEQYARDNHSRAQGIFNWKKATPVGWNSWGAIQNKITLDKAKRVIDFFADSCKGYRSANGQLYIDLDSFWDNMVKGGLDGDVSELKQFVAYCKSKGFKPGIYWAPFTDWGKHDRKMEGSAYTYAQAWLKQNGKPVEVDGALALDATHPGTKARINYYLTHLKNLGFEMIKIDFLGHGALECDRFYDPAITTGMQAYKVGMQCVTKALDNKMLVYAAISPTMATAPYVHMRRIACDAFSAIDNTEYTLNSTGYGWWQSLLYNFVDADHVVFNHESEGANRARLASALVTGTLIAGDDFSSYGPWSNAAKHLLQNKELLKVIKDGRSFRPIEANTGNKGVELFIKADYDKVYLAAFNYSNTPRTYTLSPARLGVLSRAQVTAAELLSGTVENWQQDSIHINVPPSDAKIYLIRPARTK